HLRSRQPRSGDACLAPAGGGCSVAAALAGGVLLLGGGVLGPVLVDERRTDPPVRRPRPADGIDRRSPWPATTHRCCAPLRGVPQYAAGGHRPVRGVPRV